MRTVTLLIATCVTVTAWSQQAPTSKPSVPDVITKLHSNHWSERIDAIEQIGSDKILLHSRTIQVALMDLLNQEVAEGTSSQNTSATSGEDEGEEEYSQYFSSLCYIVNTFVNWNDPRQACMMVNTAYVDYPSSPTEAAVRARAAMPCILKRSKSNLASDRAVASPMLVEAIQKARGTLDGEMVQTTQQAVLSDLRDPDPGVRSSTVYALGRYAGADMISALEQVVAKDPEPEVEGHSIRKSAAEAIAAIRRRAIQQ